jgi:hypothetical protein
MPNSIDRYIYNYEKRLEMRKHPLFIKISEEMSNSNFLTTEKVGCMSFIIREALEKNNKNNKNQLMSIYDWESYYLNSGKHRAELIQKNRGRVTYQNNEYYGRTIDDILNMSKDLYLTYKDKYNFNQQASLNIIYIKVIDESYDEYKRLINTVDLISNINPNHYFEISDALTNKEQAVDLFVYKKSNDELIGAIQILPDSYYGFEIDPDKEAEAEIFKQQHEIFKNTYDILPDRVYVSLSGQIKGNIPKY